MPPARTDYVFRNWNGSIAVKPDHFYQPDSEAEVAETVREVASRGGILRPFGAGHSWAELVPTDDSLINLDALHHLVSVDAARKQVTVQAGIRIEKLNDLVAEHGLALANVGSISQQSIAGAIATATHGTGLAIGNLSTQVVAMTLATADGRLRRISAARDPELIAAARVSLGALGIVTEVTLQCVDAFRLHARLWPLPFEEAVAQIDALIHAHDHVRLYWFANTDVIQVMTYNRTDEPRSPGMPIGDYFRDVVVEYDFLKFLVENSYAFPGLVGPINRFANWAFRWTKVERVDRSDRILNIPAPPEHDECEYAIPVERAAHAVRLLRRLIERTGYRANLPVEVRFVAADENMLSPCYRRASCYLGAYTFGEQFAQPYFAGFEGLMASLGGRPHWGKTFHATRDQLRALYPLYDRFVAIRRQLDPAGVFASPFLRDLFA
ncbi:MAG: FAD-binding protein [Myxococcales bacterium]|nr:FAD-binding protein [Myxococcales bacterium]